MFALPVIVESEGQKALLLAGWVITKGGVLFKSGFATAKTGLTASAYSGIEIEADARTPHSWYLFLHTQDNFFPWS